MDLGELAKTIKRDDNEATQQIVGRYGNMVYYNALAELGDEPRSLEVAKRVISELLSKVKEGEVPEDIPRYLQKQVRQQSRSLAAEDAIAEELKAKIAAGSGMFPTVQLEQEQLAESNDKKPSKESAVAPRDSHRQDAQVAPEKADAAPSHVSPVIASPEASSAAEAPEETAVLADEATPSEEGENKVSPLADSNDVVPDVEQYDAAIEALKEASLAPAVVGIAGAGAMGTLAATEAQEAGTAQQNTDRIPKLADAAEQAKAEEAKAKTTELAPVVVSDPPAAGAAMSPDVSAQLDLMLPKADPSETQPMRAVNPEDLLFGEVENGNKPAPTAEELHRAFYGDEKEHEQRGKAGFIAGIIIAIVLLLLLIWLIIGFLGKLDIIPELNLGYTWFNSTIYPLF